MNIENLIPDNRTKTKYALLLFGLLVCLMSFGNSPVKVIRVANKTALFVDNLPKSTIIIDTQTKSRYLTLQPILGTKSIATCTGLELRLDVINADLIEVLTATDTTESVNPRNMFDYIKVNALTYNEANQNVNLGTYNLTGDTINATSIQINGSNVLNNVRFLQDHDSLSTLQERSYNSLTDKPSLTQLHDPVTMTGSYDYITLTDQQITRNQIDYSTDISNIPATFPATSHGNESHTSAFIVQANAVVPNTAIVGGTATKITYDSKGLVIQGEAATTADINDALNKRYVTDTQLGNIHASGSDNQTISTTGAAGNITLSGSGGTLNLNVNDHLNRTALDAVSGINSGDQNLSGYKLISDTTVASGYATVHRLNGKETAFSKNTGFNKNFGTTTGTVLEGRTFGTAANSATTDFVAYRTFGSAANNNTGDFEVPLTFGTGLNRTGNTITNTVTQFSTANEIDPKYALDSAYIKSHIRNDLDLSPTNELQNIGRTGNVINISQSASTVDISFKADTTWVLNKGYLNSETPQDLSLAGNTLSLSGDATTVDISTATAVQNNTSKVSNATHTGDVEGATSTIVKGINNVALSSLATGLLKNTTGSGVPSIAVSGTDVKTINGTSILGSGNIVTSGGDVYKVASPADNQIGVWTGNGTIEGNDNFRFDSNILYLTGTTGNDPSIRMTDADFPNDYFFIRNSSSVASFWQRYGGVNYLSFTADRIGITQATLTLNDPSNYRDIDGEIRYNGSDFLGKKAGSWVSLTASAGSGMTNPMTTIGDIIYASNTGSPATPQKLGIGTSGQVLTVVSGLPSWQNATGGASQWTTHTNGIYYTETSKTVGIGTIPNSLIGLSVNRSLSGGFAGLFTNDTSNGEGLVAQVNSNNNNYYTLRGLGSGGYSFGATSSGTIDLIEQTSSAATLTGYGRIYTKIDGSNIGRLYFKNDTGTEYDLTASGSGSGLTSVGLSMPSIFSVTNSPLTSNGTISVSLANNVLQNRVFASPYAATGTPSFRALDTNDLPNTSVTPGSYTASNITVDEKGRITAASSGSGGSGMTYPAAGIALSTGSAWGTSITNNSANWNTAYSNMGKVSLYLGTGTHKYLEEEDFISNVSSFSIKRTATPTNGSATLFTSGGAFTELATKQATLVSGTNIRPVNGRSLLGSDDINLPLTKTANTSFSIDMSATTNVTVSTANNIGITFANVKNGATGNIEVIYTTGASNAIVTFYTDVTTYTFYVQPSIHGGGASNQKYVLGMNAGSRAVYSYWVVGDRIYINGTQTYL